MIWYIAEQCIGIICACLPCYRPYLLLFKRSIGYVAAVATGNSSAYHQKGSDVEMGNTYGSGRKYDDTQPKSDILTDTAILKNESGSIDGASRSVGGIEVRHEVHVASDEASSKL